MKVYDELVARGLIAQVTNEEEIREMVDNGKATFYIGFDPTADSLHVGHFMALCLMKRLQMAGNKPIALIGGGTAMIGDPSGRTDMRSMMTKETIEHNCACFKKQMERFIEFGEGKAQMVNNADWLLNLNYIDFIRDIGACFSVNNMLRAECFKQRMEKGLSFLEFNYMPMQSYDFYYLFQHYGCNMQFGGNDQWSNMLGGTELIRRKLGKDAHAMTITLELTKLVHGEEEAQKAQAAAKALFMGGAGDEEHMPTTEITADQLTDGQIGILNLMVACKLASSNKEARTLVTQGGVLVNDEKVPAPTFMVTEAMLKEGVKIRKGKKVFHKAVLV